MYIFLTILFTLTLLFAGCSSPSSRAAGGAQAHVTRPARIDDSSTQTSRQGRFTVSYASDLDPVVINQLHTWTLHVMTPDGKPLDGAIVTIDGGMPEHNHGMPTAPIVTALGDGNYRAEGMKFQMPGSWTVTVTVTDTAGAGAQVDSATFKLLLD